jgi:REP element-mobilizing transposase RayT
MSRQLRIEYEGAYYHVLSRGNDRCNIFISHDDRKEFLNYLSEISERFSVDIYAYVLMTNHYHLLLKTRKANLSKCMQWLGTAYTRRFNLLNSRSGHLFQGRFKSILVEDESYMMRLSCYIHRNPLRAGLVTRLADYKWSSYSNYAYKGLKSDFLNTDFILSCLNAKDKHMAYRKMVQQYANETKSVWEDVKHGLIYGSQSFVNTMKSIYLSGSHDKELPQLNKFLNEEDPTVLLAKCAAVLGCDLDEYKRAPRLSGTDKDNRDILMYMLWKTGNYKNEQIGELFGLTFSSVSRSVNHVKSSLGKKTSLNDTLGKVMTIIKV